RGAEVLDLHVGVAERADGGADLLEVGALRVVDLHHRAAGEFDRQVQPARRQEEHRQQERDDGNRVQHQCVAHERDVALDPEEFHRSAVRLRARQAAVSGFQICPIEIFVSLRWRPYQRFTRPREKNTAENIDVSSPSTWTTANPRAGPEPNTSSATPAISEVTLESRIVAQARS